MRLRGGARCSEMFRAASDGSRPPSASRGVDLWADGLLGSPVPGPLPDTTSRSAGVDDGCTLPLAPGSLLQVMVRLAAPEKSSTRHATARSTPTELARLNADLLSERNHR